jgi:hypothetical protein
MNTLNRQETEDLVRDLYYNQKKTFREIQKIIRKSPRDIKKIIDKADPDKPSSLSQSSQAYRMFKEGSQPIDVAIALNLRLNEVGELYREYLDLNGMHQLNQIYKEIKDDIWSVIELNRRMKSEGLNQQQVIRIFRNSIFLEDRIRELESEQARLAEGNKQAAKTFQHFTDLRTKDSIILQRNHLLCDRFNQEIEHLRTEKAKLENVIESIRLNNEIFIKIKQIVEQEIKSFISNPRWLLRIALASLFESERINRGTLRSLYYDTLPALSVDLLFSQSSFSLNKQSQDQSVCNRDSLEALLIDEAEQLYIRIVEALMSECINEIAVDTGSVPPPPQLPDMPHNHFTQVVHDTCESECDKQTHFKNKVHYHATKDN